MGINTSIFYENDGVFRIEVVIGENRECIDMRTEMAINEKNLPKEFSEQPGKFAWYSALLADQEDKYGEKKRELDVCKAEISMQIRQGKIKITDVEGEKIKITEGGISDYIEADKKFKTIQQEAYELESICKRLKVLVNASMQRKDMLINLGLLERAERKQFNT